MRQNQAILTTVEGRKTQLLHREQVRHQGGPRGHRVRGQEGASHGPIYK